MRDTFLNPAFQLKLVTLLVKDSKFLRQCAHMLNVEDFEPKSDSEPRAAWIIAGAALDYWGKYGDNIGAMLPTEIKRLISENRWGERQLDDLKRYVQSIRESRPKASDYARDIIIRWRKHQLRTTSINEIIDLHAAGSLTDERFLEICAEATTRFRQDRFQSSTIFTDTGDYEKDVLLDRRALSARSTRRIDQASILRLPRTLIQPLDDLVQGIGRGHLGMVMAPTGRGKSMMLAWLSVALAFQGWSVLYFTLEDPLQDIEDRVDSLVSAIKIKELFKLPDDVGKYWQNYRRNVRGNFRIVDCTEQPTTLQQIESEWEQQRQRGFSADVVMIDYDQIVTGSKDRREKREELEDLYVALVQFARRNRVLVWTASQTWAQADDKVGMLTMKDLAEHKGKLRHVTLALSLGLAEKEWPKEAMCLGVPKHRNDVSMVSCTIVPDKSCMRIYDHERTVQAREEISDLPAQDVDSGEKESEEDFGV